MMRRLLNLAIWELGILLMVRMGVTYENPIPLGIAWIGLVSVKNMMEAVGE